MTPTMPCPRCWGARSTGVAEICGYCHGRGVVDDQPLSPHFMLSELLVSETAARRGIPNDPPDEFLPRLRQLAGELLEPIRSRFGPIHVNSGYRAPDVNRAIGGSATSAHCESWAADLVPLITGITRKQIVDWVVASELAFDQVIFEGTWVHVGRFSPSGGVRREALSMFPAPGGGGPRYFPYDPADPRVCT